MFSNDPDIPQRECCALLERSWSVFSEGSKLTREFSQLPKVMQKLYIMYVSYIYGGRISNVMCLDLFIPFLTGT